MAAIHSKDTKPEMVMRRYLRGHGLRSQLNHPRLSGEPDIVMREYWTGYHSIAIMTLYLFGNIEQLNLIEELAKNRLVHMFKSVPDLQINSYKDLLHLKYSM